MNTLTIILIVLTAVLLIANIVMFTIERTEKHELNFDKSKVKIMLFASEDEDEEMITQPFLNLEVELIPPKEKKYLVKFNMRGWIERFSYLNYYEKNESIELNTKQSSVFCKASFTKSELQSIQPVREFLEDMEGKYELIEVEDNEID